MKCVSSLIAAVLMFGLAGCKQKSAETSSVAPAGDTNPPISGSPDVKFFLVRGVVKKIEPEQKTITIQHEEIPQYMPGMTMPFNIKDTNELAKVEVGDTVWFRLWVSPTESWVDKLQKEQKPAGSTSAPPPQVSAPTERESFRLARDVDPLNVGEMMPDYGFTNELGRTVHLGDFKGDALAFTFIFTRCPLPDFCPKMSRNFSEVCQKLKVLPNGPTNWHLLSISFDPNYDTPAVLRAYAQVFQNYDPARWNFVTGAMIDIDAITDQFNLPIVKRGNEWDHKVRTVVVDANGRIQNIIIGNQWTPDALVEDIVKAARPQPAADTARQG